MTVKKHFFITVNTEDIRETSVPDGIEYEVIATPQEVDEIRQLFREMNQDSKNAVKFLAKPFHEWGADEKREQYDEHLMAIYQRIYDLGTEETRKNINEMGIIN